MTELEDRLRRDLQQVSERAGAGSIRPLREPPARRKPRAVRWLAPAAAVAAVIGVVTGVTLASRSQGHRPAPLQSPVPPPEPAGTMPPYYVTAFQSFVGAAPSHVVTMAAVHDSVTGATLTTVPLPTLTDSQGGTEGPSITAAGDDRTFVITEQSDSPRVVRFYRLRVAADGRSATLSRLPVSVPGYLSVTDVALSPDGSRLALDVQHCQVQSCPYTGVRVATIATGAVSTWVTRANGAPFGVSWAGNKLVSFEWQSGARTPPAGQSTGYRLLSLAGAGRDLLAARRIAGPPAVATGFVPPALVTPDGRAVITSTVRNIPEGSGRDTVVAKIVELDASTGQLLKVLYTAIAHHVTTQLNVTQANVPRLDQGCQVLSLGPAGVQPLVNCFAFGRVENGRLTPLPGFLSPSASGIAGQRAAAW